MKIAKAFEILVTVIVVGLIGYIFFWDLGIQEMSQFYEASNRFCVDNGYNKSTDYNEGYNTVKIECDKNVILEAIISKPCIKSNKWNECEEYGVKLHQLHQ